MKKLFILFIAITPYLVGAMPLDAAFLASANDSTNAPASLVTYATLASATSGTPATWSDFTLSAGNLVATANFTGVWRQGMANMGKSSGKWYWECTKTVTSATGDLMVGVSSLFHSRDHYLGKLNDDSDWGYNNYGQKTRNRSPTSYGSSFTKGDVLGVALDMDAGKIYFYKNGVIQNSGTEAFTDITGTVYPTFTSAGNYQYILFNFGASPFAYTVPSGYNAGVYTTP